MVQTECRTEPARVLLRCSPLKLEERAGGSMKKQSPLTSFLSPEKRGSMFSSPSKIEGVGGSMKHFRIMETMRVHRTRFAWKLNRSLRSLKIIIKILIQPSARGSEQQELCEAWCAINEPHSISRRKRLSQHLMPNYSSASWLFDADRRSFSRLKLKSCASCLPVVSVV